MQQRREAGVAAAATAVAALRALHMLCMHMWASDTRGVELRNDQATAWSLHTRGVELCKIGAEIAIAHEHACMVCVYVSQS